MKIIKPKANTELKLKIATLRSGEFNLKPTYLIIKKDRLVVGEMNGNVKNVVTFPISSITFFSYGIYKKS